MQSGVYGAAALVIHWVCISQVGIKKKTDEYQKTTRGWAKGWGIISKSYKR